MRLRITELRKMRGMSQGDLAAKLGISLSMMGKLERGERRLNTDWIFRISAILEVKEEELLDFLDFSRDDIHIVGLLRKDGVYEDYKSDISDDRSSMDHQIEKQHFGPDLLRGIQVQSDLSVMVPDGSIIVYRPPMRPPSAEMANCPAMVILDDLAHPWALGRILPGSESGRYHVLMSNGEMLQNARVRGLMPVTEIRLPAYAQMVRK